MAEWKASTNVAGVAGESPLRCGDIRSVARLATEARYNSRESIRWSRVRRGHHVVGEASSVPASSAGHSPDAGSLEDDVSNSLQVVSPTRRPDSADAPG